MKSQEATKVELYARVTSCRRAVVGLLFFKKEVYLIDVMFAYDELNRKRHVLGPTLTTLMTIRVEREMFDALHVRDALCFTFAPLTPEQNILGVRPYIVNMERIAVHPDLLPLAQFA